jgi:hypothetical protein
MKKIFLFLTLALSMVACKKSYTGDTYNFENTLPPYVELEGEKNVEVSEGNMLTVTVVMRVAQQQDVQVNYAVTGTLNKQGTITIKRNTLKASANVAIPAGTLPATATSGKANLQITGATTTASNTALTIGRFGSENEKLDVTIVK